MRIRSLAAATVLTLAPAIARAQFRALNTIGSIAEDRLRLSQLSDSAPTAGFLIRSAGSVGVCHPPSAICRPNKFHAFAILPEVAIVWNSRLPLSLNDGAMWAGRGINALARVGAGFDSKLFSLVLAPEITYSQNLGFETFQSAIPGRSPWSSPWHTGNASADLPLRFGNQSLTLASLGQSSVTFHANSFDFGVSSENQWWGPGIRNALVMSNQAEGVPHAFLRSPRPIKTGIGDFEWRIIAGALTESIYFDTVSTNNARSLSGFVVTWRPAVAPHLTLGLARIVVAPANGTGTVMQGALNAFTKWHPEKTPVTKSDSLQGDQLMSLFGRWIFPRDHLELYFEWAKSALPRSLRGFAIAPQDAQGYTLGFQWLLPVAVAVNTRGKIAVRIQAEATNVEQSTVFSNHPIRDFYTGSTTAQGFTQRGQVLGAAVGPGGQSEWLAADYMKNDWSLGVMLQRIRWEDNALYRQPLPDFFKHDVTLMAGVRGTLRTRSYDLSASISANPRQDYLFQNGFANPSGIRTVDVPNFTFTLGVAPR